MPNPSWHWVNHRGVFAWMFGLHRIATCYWEKEMLSDDEINKICVESITQEDDVSTLSHRKFARAIIAAYQAKLLAEVEMPEPEHYWEPDGTLEWLGKDGSGFSTNTGPAHGWKVTNYFTADQLQQYAAAVAAQARVQALDEAKQIVEHEIDNWDDERPLLVCAAAIDKLKGGE